MEGFCALLQACNEQAHDNACSSISVGCAGVDPARFHSINTLCAVISFRSVGQECGALLPWTFVKQQCVNHHRDTSLWIDTVIRQCKRHTRMVLVPTSSSTSASGSMIAVRRYSSVGVSRNGPRPPSRGVRSKCSLISMSCARSTTACFSCTAVLTTVMLAGPRISPPPSTGGGGAAARGAGWAILTGTVSPACRRVRALKASQAWWCFLISLHCNSQVMVTSSHVAQTLWDVCGPVGPEIFDH